MCVQYSNVPSRHIYFLFKNVSTGEKCAQCTEIMSAVITFQLFGECCRSNTFRKMEDCQLVCAMGPPGGGRNPLTPRFARHYNMVSIVDFDTSTTMHIFTSIINAVSEARSFPENIRVRKHTERPKSSNSKLKFIGESIRIFLRAYFKGEV